MSGMRGRILRELLGRSPDYAVRSSYIYRRAFDHIIAGIYLESVPSGVYLWEFALPLYDGTAEPHLTFGRRIGKDGGFLGMDGKDMHILDIVYEMLQSIDGEIGKISTLEGFREWISGGSERNIYAEFADICSLVLLRRCIEAREQLDRLLGSGRTARYDELHLRVSALKTSLDIDAQSATDLLLGWEGKVRPYWLK